MEPGLDYHGREQYKSRQSIPYFIRNHVHYGWYPEVILTPDQEAILALLIASPVLSIKDGPELKWPLAGYLLHQLVFGEGVRVAIVAPQQWQANRRYQGLLYPLDQMQDIFTPDCVVRTSQELELTSGNCVKAFTEDANWASYSPTLLVVEPGAATGGSASKVIRLTP